jgi:hypothetical protein
MLQQFAARSNPLTPGEMYNPVPGSKEALRGEDMAWEDFQTNQPLAYQQARPVGTLAAFAVDPLNFTPAAVPVVKGAGRLAQFAVKNAMQEGAPNALKALANQRGMFVPPTAEQLGTLARVAKGEQVDDVPWVWSELTDRMPRTEISDDARWWKFPTAEGMDKAFAGKVNELDRPLLVNDVFDAPRGVEDFRVSMLPSEAMGNSQGSLSGENIRLNSNLDPVQARNTLLHEGQHAVQERGGWARGGSPFDKNLPSATSIAKDVNARYSQELNRLAKENRWDEYIALDDKRRTEVDSIFSEDKNGGDIGGLIGYRRLAGEEEARRTATRAGMTMAERYGNPYKGTDIQDPRDLIVRMNNR